MTQFLYRAYELTISSPIVLPLPEVSDRGADVRIVLGANLDAGEANELAGHRWVGRSGWFKLMVQGVAQYVIEEGCIITINPTKTASHSDLVAFLMSSALGALLQQRGALPFHASTVATNRGAVLMLGKSGAGKSTTMTALTRRGFAMVSDDITPVSLRNGQLVALPAYPSTRLWADALDGFGYSAELLLSVRENISKYYLNIGTFHDQPEQVAGGVILQVHNEPQIEVTHIPQSEAFGVFSRFTFRKRFLKCQNLLPFQFSVTTALAKGAPVIRVNRPMAPFCADEVAEKITNALAIAPYQPVIA